MAYDIEDDIEKREEKNKEQFGEENLETFDTSDKPKVEQNQNPGLVLKNRRAMAKYLEGLEKEKQAKENVQENLEIEEK